MLEYDIIGGVPVRIIKADKSIWSTTFSKDGRLLAVGVQSSCIKILRTTDYALVGIKEGISPLKMCFIDGENQVLRIITRDKESSIAAIDLQIKPNDPIDDPIERENGGCTFKRVRYDVLSNQLDPMNKMDFSDDGETLIMREGNTVTLFRFLDVGFIERVYRPRSIQISDEGYSMVSANGQSLFSVLRQIPSESGKSQEMVAVWPRLRFDTDTVPEPVIIEGYRGLWTSSGEHLVVWNDNGESPGLCVYKTEDLADGRRKPSVSRVLSSELENSEAIGCKHLQNSLLIREDYKSGVLRLLKWNVEEDKLREISMIEQKEPISDLVDSGSNPMYFGSLESQFPSGSLESLNSGSMDLRFPSSNIDGDPRYLGMMHVHYHSFCIGYDGRWIGSFSRRGDTVSIVSPWSGAVAFKCELPRSALSNTWPSAIMFDPSGQHLLIVCGNILLVFAPPMLFYPQPQQISTIGIPDKVLWDDRENNLLREAFQVMSSQALTMPCNEWQFLSQLYEDVSSPSRRFQKMALSSNGKWSAWCRVDKRLEPVAGIMHSVISADGQKKITLSRLPLNGFHPTSVFVSPSDGDNDRVIFLATGSNPQVLVFDMDGHQAKGSGRRTVLDIESCLHVSQTRDRRNLVIVESKAVCLVDLDTLIVKERIEYQTDLKEMLRRIQGKIGHVNFQAMMDRRMVSDDGRIILLGWDPKDSHSILVKPSTDQQECEAAIEVIGEDLSPFCQLTGDGNCTLFTDIAALSKDRLIIGIYSNEDSRVRNNICVIEDSSGMNCISEGNMLLLNHFFYEMSENSSEIFVLMLPYEDLKQDGMSFGKEIKRFSIYATEECIPDYDRFVRSSKTTAAEKVRNLSTKFCSETIFNHPVSDNKSIFQEAYLAGNKDIVQSVMSLAEEQKIKLAIRWLPSTSEKLKEEEADDLLMHSLKSNVLTKAEEAIDFMMSKACTYQDTARVWRSNFAEALRMNPQRIVKALLEDEFIVELCKLEVNATFLDPVKRRDTALHINTLDEVQPWTLEEDPTKLARMWRTKNVDTVEAMEKEGNISRAMASLKVICVEGADLPGHQGLIRHLLLHGVRDDVFKSKAVKWIVSRKWFKIWRRKFLWKAGWHFIFLVCLSAYAMALGQTENFMVLGQTENLIFTSINHKLASSLILPFLWIYGVLITVEETKQITSLMEEGTKAQRSRLWGVRYYFNSKWNWIDTASCLLLVLLIPLFHSLSFFIIKCNPMLSAAVAVAVLLAYIKVWYFAQPFRVTGALVLMIEKIIRDCMAFLGLTLIVLLGFALAIHVMSRSITNEYRRIQKEMRSSNAFSGNEEIGIALTNSDHDNDEDNYDKEVADSFGTFRSSIMTLFYALFGEFEREVYSTKHELSWMILATFVTYMIAQIVVMLNLLISIMGDTFDRVKSNEEGQMLMARAMIIDSCEASASKEETEEMDNTTGMYVCALESSGASSHGRSLFTWTGRMNMLVEKIRMTIVRSQAIIENALEQAIEKAVERMKDAIKEVQQLVERVNTAVNATTDVKDQVDGIHQAVEIAKRETKEEVNAVKEEVNAVKEVTAAMKGEVENRVNTLMTSISEQDKKVEAINDQLERHAAEQASAIANLEARLEQNSQDVSAKLERLLSLVEDFRAT